MDNWDHRKLLLFGGKGGVGKTTTAAAVSLILADRNRDRRLLVISTDPAHSLGDSLGRQLSGQVTAMPGVPNLFAQELDAPRLFEEFKALHGHEMKTLTERGTYLDMKDIEDFMSLSLPGMDEVMAIIEVAKLLKAGKFDLIILDTAPTGHTLRMLALPHCMEDWIRVMELTQGKHRYLARQFAGRYQKDAADLFLETMLLDMKMVDALLKNPETTEFVPVTIPEQMSLQETLRLVEALEKNHIPVRNIMVNRVREEHDCPYCIARKIEQDKTMTQMDLAFARYRLRKLPLLPTQVKGMKDLAFFGRLIFSDNRPELPVHLVVAAAENEEAALPVGSLDDLIVKNPQFLLFGGKGGVGKTSVSAATALYYSLRFPEKKILLFSTDPARSLSDSLRQSVTDRITPIRLSGGISQVGSTNLFAIEIDAVALFHQLKTEYVESVEEMFSKLLKGGVDVKFDREVLTALISLSPPGLDEAMALKEIMDLHGNGEFDYFILDTAPTGHLLRFLSTPNLIRSWLNTLFGVMIKYKGMIRLDRVVDRLLELSRGLRKIRNLFEDPQKTLFVGVTIPETMAILETRRLFDELANLRITASHLIVNMISPSGKCRFCRQKRNEQQGFIRQIRQEFSSFALAELPLFPHEMTGVDNLRKISDLLYDGKAMSAGNSA